MLTYLIVIGFCYDILLIISNKFKKTGKEKNEFSDSDDSIEDLNEEELFSDKLIAMRKETEYQIR